MLFLLLLIQNIPEEERNLIREAQMEIPNIKKKYWPGWQEIPFTVLLIHGDSEYLINHPKPKLFSDDVFTDEILGPIYRRERQFPANLAATFPLVDAHPVIVMGDLKNSNFNQERWYWTLFHEHIHQLQMSHPKYMHNSNELGLAKDEDDFMWQLNYPFPYENKEAGQQLQNMGATLASWLKTQNPKLISQYYEQKMALYDIISEKDKRYLNFQIWQEGLPRFLEIDALAFREVDSSQLREQYMQSVLNDLDQLQANEQQRTIFYAIGVGEWSMIQYLNPNWQTSYFVNMFQSDYYFQ